MYRLKIITVIFGITLTTAGNAAVFTVNSIADPGNGACDETECTLREAINAANAISGKDIIKFRIPGCGPGSNTPNVCTISVQTTVPDSGLGLPVITDAVEMNGTINENRAGIPGNPRKRPGVEINVSAVIPALKEGPFGTLPFFTNGLYLRGPETSGSFIRGLVINGFNGSTSDICVASLLNPVNPLTPVTPALELCGQGILVFAGNNVKILGNYLGLDAEGNFSVGNPVKLISILDGSHNIIGGAHVRDRNVGSGNNDGTLFQSDISSIGIFLSGWSEPAFGAPKKTNGNLIIGNYIGLTAKGLALNPLSIGIQLMSLNIPDNLLIPGRYGYGPQCSTADPNVPGHCEMTRNVIKANTINNQSLAISLTNYSLDTVIRGNHVFGNVMYSPFAYVFLENLDYQGLDSPEPKIPVNTKIVGNHFGVDSNSMPTAGTSSNSVSIFSGDGVLIKNNIIRGGLKSGVIILDSTFQGATSAPINVTVTKNSIYDNGLFNGSPSSELPNGFIDFELGIDLGSGPPFIPGTEFDGVTPNDEKDFDMSANNLQNFPLLEKAEKLGSSQNLKVRGTLNAHPNTWYRVEFFANDKARIQSTVVIEGMPTNDIFIAEGKIYLGKMFVKTKKNGNAKFIKVMRGHDLPDCAVTDFRDGLPLPEAEIYNTCITATATRIDDSGNLTDTSEFSPAVILNDEN